MNETSILPWSAQQVDTFAREIRLQWGSSWSLFGRDVQIAFVEQKVAQVAASSPKAEFTGRNIARLIGELTYAMGLED
jgi:hypothetical protein